MLEELTPTHITDFGGLYDRGPDEVVPPSYFSRADNLRFFNGGFETRYGTSISVAVPAGVRRFFPYQIEGQADRIIYLDTTGKIFDSLYPDTAILEIIGMTDFSMIVLNDRAYLSPQNGITGMPGQKVYIYQGAGALARPAAGSPPSGFTLNAVPSVNAGITETGFRLFAVAYETDSGFITRPGPGVFAQYSEVQGYKVSLSGIQTGPAGTIARHILATRAIFGWDGNQDNPELFFVEGGSIPDNVTEAKEVDFYDSQLVRSADYLKEEMIEIPAVLGFTTFAGSLVGWAPNVEPSSVYISRAGEPESISLTEGGIEVDIATGGGVKNCVEYRGASLMIHKSGKIYSTSNNGEEPVHWEVNRIDSAIGTEVFGVAAILDEEGNTVDRYILATKKGVIAYAGNFENVISKNIDDLWKRITKTAFNKIQVVLDPINELLVLIVPLDGSTTPNTLLYCDYQRGLDPDNVRWSVWTFPFDPSSVGFDLDINGEPVLKISSTAGNVYYLDPSAQGDNLVAIPQPTFQTAYTGDGSVAVNYYGGVRLRATGTGPLSLQVLGMDDAVTVNPPGFVLTQSPGRLLQRDFNLQSQMARLKGWTTDYGARFRVTRISIYHAPFWVEEPA